MCFSGVGGGARRPGELLHQRHFIGQALARLVVHVDHVARLQAVEAVEHAEPVECARGYSCGRSARRCPTGPGCPCPARWPTRSGRCFVAYRLSVSQSVWPLRVTRPMVTIGRSIFSFGIESRAGAGASRVGVGVGGRVACAAPATATGWTWTGGRRWATGWTRTLPGPTARGSARATRAGRARWSRTAALAARSQTDRRAENPRPPGAGQAPGRSSPRRSPKVTSDSSWAITRSILIAVYPGSGIPNAAPRRRRTGGFQPVKRKPRVAPAAG